jgi:hypothetical protein
MLRNLGAPIHCFGQLMRAIFLRSSLMTMNASARDFAPSRFNRPCGRPSFLHQQHYGLSARHRGRILKVPRSFRLLTQGRDSELGELDFSPLGRARSDALAKCPERRRWPARPFVKEGQHPEEDRGRRPVDERALVTSETFPSAAREDNRTLT